MRVLSALALITLLTVSVAGCHVSTHKDGRNDNVDIGTPFGSMSVKTHDDVAASGLGLSPYPGAVLEKKDKDGDHGAADVNMSFGSFHLGVKAVSYLTGDAPDKVLAFYQNDMKRYGQVLHCEGSQAIGQPTRTAEGLTCDKDSHSHNGNIGWDNEAHGRTELRAGSKQHQHIVAVEPKNGGTKIGLVALDLPSGISTGDDGKESD